MYFAGKTMYYVENRKRYMGKIMYGADIPGGHAASAARHSATRVKGERTPHRRAASQTFGKAFAQQSLQSATYGFETEIGRLQRVERHPAERGSVIAGTHNRLVGHAA